MGILATVSNLLKGPSAVFQPANGNTTESGMSFARIARGFWSNKIWFADMERKAIYDDLENMVANDGITDQALDTMAEVALGMEDGFTDKFQVNSDDEEALAILNDLIYRLRLRRDAKDIIRKMLRHGNEFREIVVGQDNSGRKMIVRLRADMPAYTMYPNLDDDGNQRDDFPWVQKNIQFFFGKEVLFRPWQLANWGYGEKTLFLNTPFMASARRNSKLLQVMEDSLGLARLGRAHMKLVHKIPVPARSTGDQQRELVEQYKKNIEKKDFYNFAQGKTTELDNPIQADTDFYIPEDGSKRGGIEVVDPKNNNLMNIDDVIYAQSKHIARLGVPRDYLNIEGANSSALNQNSSGSGDKHFRRKVRDIQSCFIEGLQQVFNVELLLHGINPLNDNNTLIYDIEMSDVESGDAYSQSQAEQTNATAAETWSRIAEVPDGLLEDKFMKMNDKQKAKYGGKIKMRTKPNPAFQTGGQAGPGTPVGKRPGTDVRKRDKQPAK